MSADQTGSDFHGLSRPGGGRRWDRRLAPPPPLHTEPVRIAGSDITKGLELLDDVESEGQNIEADWIIKI